MNAVFDEKGGKPVIPWGRHCGVVRTSEKFITVAGELDGYLVTEFWRGLASGFVKKGHEA